MDIAIAVLLIIVIQALILLWILTEHQYFGVENISILAKKAGVRAKVKELHQLLFVLVSALSHMVHLWAREYKTRDL